MKTWLLSECITDNRNTQSFGQMICYNQSGYYIIISSKQSRQGGPRVGKGLADVNLIHGSGQGRKDWEKKEKIREAIPTIQK